jgi:hypothetical protein
MILNELIGARVSTTTILWVEFPRSRNLLELISRSARPAPAEVSLSRIQGLVLLICKSTAGAVVPMPTRPKSVITNVLLGAPCSTLKAPVFGLSFRGANSTPKALVSRSQSSTPAVLISRNVGNPALVTVHGLPQSSAIAGPAHASRAAAANAKLIVDL